MEAGALKVTKEPCDLTDVVGAVLAQLEDRVAGRAVRVDIPPDLPLVPMDFVLIAQVLTNLLDNAVKYSPSATPVELAARVVGDRDRQAKAPVLLELTVADRGSGIPAQELGRVFDKFHRVQRAEDAVTPLPPGTGLGLAISKGIVEAHEGSIEARNRPGGGTVIRLTLPLGVGADAETEARL